MKRSQSKLRPSLPLLKDAPTEPSPAPDPRQGRDQAGRFAPGHRQSARSRGWRKALVQLAGPDVASSEVHKLACESGTLYRARLGELPHQGPTVSALVAEGARSTVLSVHLAARALAVGIETAKGRALLDASMKLGQRAERTAVTAYDLAQRLAEAERKAKPSPFFQRFGSPGAAAPWAPPSASSPAPGATTGRADASAHADAPAAVDPTSGDNDDA